MLGVGSCVRRGQQWEFGAVPANFLKLVDGAGCGEQDEGVPGDASPELSKVAQVTAL